MKRTLFYLLGICVITSFMALSNKQKPVIYMIGDSTMSNKSLVGGNPERGWGHVLPGFFSSEIKIDNHAVNGRSSLSFMSRWNAVYDQLKKGDYVFIQFGHNDQKQKGPGRGAYYSFATSLKTFIDEVRQRGGHPVLVTPTCRRAFKDGKIQPTHADYPDAVHWVAEREQVPLIDLQEMTRVLFEALGEEGSKRAFVHYPAGTYPGQDKALADNTHFNPYGAYQIARCVIEGMKQARLPFVDHLREDVQPFRPSVPDSPDAFHWDESPFVEMQKPDGN